MINREEQICETNKDSVSERGIILRIGVIKKENTPAIISITAKRKTNWLKRALLCRSYVG